MVGIVVEQQVGTIGDLVDSANRVDEKRMFHGSKGGKEFQRKFESFYLTFSLRSY